MSVPFRTRTVAGAHYDVLVADDLPGDNLLLKLAAEDAGAAITFSFAEDGEQLLDALAERHRAGNLPDLIVLDIRMPRCSGLEVMKQLSENPQYRHIPVVMFSVSRREADMNQGLAFGARRFVRKPNSYNDLMSFTTELVTLLEGTAA